MQSGIPSIYNTIQLYESNTPAQRLSFHESNKSFGTFVKYKRQKYEFCKALARVADLAVTPSVKIYRTQKKDFIWKKPRILL